MCGIFGFVTRQRANCSAINVGEALAALRHRGPDDSGIFKGEAQGAYCELGHTRLSIIDLSSAGHQPMETADGRWVITYNGEIFNFAEIRRELEAQGSKFFSNCDTEVILLAYRRWGAQALSRLQGMFSFAIFDRQEGTLFAARDRLGIKPFYYAEIPGGLVFSSEIRALMAAGAVSRRLSVDAVRGYLALGSVPEPYTILDGVRALPAGSVLELKSSGLTIHPFWQIPQCDDADEQKCTEKIEGLREALRDAIRLRLIADVPIGVFLSGGVDSSAIVAIAAEYSNSPLHTFTITLDEARLNEGHYAASTARRFGCMHQAVCLSAYKAREEIDEALAALDQPSADGVNTYFVSKAVRQAGIVVALSGLGGDELFAGYPVFRYLPSLLKMMRWMPALGRFHGHCGGAWADYLPNKARKAMALAMAGHSPLQAYAVARSFFSPEQRRSLLGPHAASESWGDFILRPAFDEKQDSLDPINVYSGLELLNYMRNTLLRDSDVMSMAHALELRVPLLDHRVVEHVASIPGSYKVRRGLNKPLLVDAVPTIPKMATKRRKMGFTLPFDSWLRGSLKNWAQRCLMGEKLKKLQVLQPAAVERNWHIYLKGDQYLSHSRIWALIALQKWCENNQVWL